MQRKVANHRVYKSPTDVVFGLFLHPLNALQPLWIISPCHLQGTGTSGLSI